MTTRKDLGGTSQHHGPARWAVIVLLTVLGLVITALDVVVPRPAAAAVADAYEPDDSAASANSFTVDGPVQQHTIAPEGDQDWVSFSVTAGTTYLLETSEGSPAESMDTLLRLYDADGTTLLYMNDDDGDGYYSRLEYPADASKTVFLRVTSADAGAGAYALSVTTVVPPGGLTVPANGVDLGYVAVGSTSRVTIPVQNTGSGPVTVGQVSLNQPGWTIVRDELGGTTIPAGATRELEVQYAPTVAFQGLPVAVYDPTNNLAASYLYSGGVIYGAVVYTGFQNVGGAGVLPWHVTGCQPSSPLPCYSVFDQQGSGSVVPGGRYTVRTVISALDDGSGRVDLLAPVTDSVGLGVRPTGLSGLTYVRQWDAYVTIESDDPESPTYVDLFGVAVPTAPATVSEQRPDGWISTVVKGQYIGNNVYNSTAVGQTKKLKARRTQARVFYVRVYNDGNVRSTFAVTGTAARPRSKVTYLEGTRDITSAIRSTAGWRVTLDPGAYSLVKVRIKIRAGAAIGSARPARVTATWTGDGVRSDTVKAVVKVIR